MKLFATWCYMSSNMRWRSSILRPKTLFERNKIAEKLLTTNIKRI